MDEKELLFTGILKCSRTDLYLNKDLILDRRKSWAILAALKRRLRGEPVQYILGNTEFMGLEFKVNPDVFIPRPETEILVETVLRLTRSLGPRVKIPILDLGTGSGCIAIALAKFLPDAKITAIDISDKALGVARQNARLNKVRVKFLKKDLTRSWELEGQDYDLIVSNPPYVSSAKIGGLQPEIRHEPRIALDAGPDGLDFYRIIVRQADLYLKEGGFLIMEMGFGQRQDLENILQEPGNFEIKEVIKDYNYIDRVIVAQKR